MSAPDENKRIALQFIEDALQVVRQRALEFHPAAVRRMVKHEPRRMQKRPLQVHDRTHVSRHPAPGAATSNFPRRNIRTEAGSNVVSR